MKSKIRLIMSFLCLSALVSACGPKQVEVNPTDTSPSENNNPTQTKQAASATATVTPNPTATQTPVPTVTPTYTPTFTPSPTKNPLAGEFVDGKMVMSNEAYETLTNIGQEWYSGGLYLLEIVLYDAMYEYSLDPDQLAYILKMQADDYEALGHYDLAIENLLQTLDLGIRKPSNLNSLCWDYAITNDAETALPYCEEAVKQDPSCANLDSRGLAYAMLDRYPEAVKDFEDALALEGYPTNEDKAQRQRWVASLKAGNNPITAQVLEQLRAEEKPLAIEPEYTSNLQLSQVRQYFEGEGYKFESTQVSGQEGVMGSFQQGDCKNEILLLGNEGEFKGGTSTILNCSHNDLSSYAWMFTYAFAKDLNEMARALVWQSADYYYVIEGKPITDLSPVIGNFQFSVERTSQAGVDGIIVTAKPVK